jgi:hypothetical protein
MDSSEKFEQLGYSFLAFSGAVMTNLAVNDAPIWFRTLVATLMVAMFISGAWLIATVNNLIPLSLHTRRWTRHRLDVLQEQRAERQIARMQAEYEIPPPLPEYRLDPADEEIDLLGDRLKQPSLWTKARRFLSRKLR